MTHPPVLIIHKDHPIHLGGVNGGAEAATLALARALTRHGVQVVLGCMLTDGAPRTTDFEVIDLGSHYNCRGALEQVSARGRYYLLSGGRALPLVLAEADQHCLSRVLIIHERHGSDVGLRLGVAAHYAERIACVSLAHAEELLKAGAPRDKLQVIHNGVDLELFTPGDVSRRNWKRIVFAGALVQDKGVHLLLQSYADLKSRFPDLILDVYGSAALWGREEFLDTQALMQQLPGLAFHGGVGGAILARAFQEAGVLVFPSIWFETFGLTLAEALATGCPVVAFDVGGPRDIVRNGHNGLLLKDISRDALTQALSELLAEPAALKAFSDEALRHRGQFDWNKTARQILRVCQETERVS